jgi:hypothetical protein
MEVLAVCHVHSVWSYDGSWPLEDLSAKFSRQGCRVLMMTEHDRGFTQARLEEYRQACAQASSDKILIVPGIEYSDAANRVHVLVWGNVPFLGENLPTGEMLAAVKAANGIAVLAHPSRKRAWECFEPQWADQFLGIEAWNRKYDGWAPSETLSPLLENSGAVPFVGLDFHTERQSFPLTMALDMDSAVTEETVLGCLRLRRCSARAFGSPLGQGLIRSALPALKIAEHGRRKVASIAKRSKVRPH